jgi:hypothetical protein
MTTENTITEDAYETEQTAELAVTANNTIMDGLCQEVGQSIESYGFDESTTEGITRIFNAGSDAESLNDSGLTKLTIDGIMIKPGVRVDPVSGTRTPCANTTFFSVDGKTYVTQSTGIARDAARLVMLMDKIGWGEGKTVRIVETKLQGGRTLKKLALA